MIEAGCRSVGIIGTGRYGGALVHGLVKAKGQVLSIAVHDKAADRAQAISRETGALCVPSLQELVLRSDLIVLAVSDEAAYAALREIANVRNDCWIISVCSSLTHAKAREVWPRPKRFIRALFNILVRFGRGQTAVSLGSDNAEGRAVAALVFDSVGSIFWVAEDRIPVFRATAGVAPGVVWYLISQLVESICGSPADKIELQRYWLSAAREASDLAIEECSDLHAMADLAAGDAGATRAALRVLQEPALTQGLQAASMAALTAARLSEEKGNAGEA